MLDDLAYSEAAKGRPWVEARLRAADRWIASATVAVGAESLDVGTDTGCDAGSSTPEDLRRGDRRPDAERPRERGLDLARPEPLSTLTDKSSETQRIAPMAMTYNGVSTPTQDEVMALYNQAELHTLQQIANDTSEEGMNRAPYNTPPTKHGKALAAVLAGRVHAVDDARQIWEVTGEDDTPTKRVLYMVDKLGCSCPHSQKTNQGRYGCYHACAAELYDRLQKALQPSLFTAPKTAEERLAAPPQELVQEAPSMPVETSQVQDVSEGTMPPEPPLVPPECGRNDSDASPDPPTPPPLDQCDCGRFEPTAAPPMLGETPRYAQTTRAGLSPLAYCDHHSGRLCSWMGRGNHPCR